MDLIKWFLELELGFKEIHLLLAEPIVEALGNVDADKIYAFEKAISKEVSKGYPEIASQGLRSIGTFMKAMGYDWTREILLNACKTIK